MNNISTYARIPYENRTSWMAEIHYNYGRKMHLHDIDYVISEQESRTIWMEHVSAQGVALAEFKNHNELIELYKYGQLVWLADGRNIPAYIVVGTKEPYVYYYIIPLNEACKKVHPSIKEGRYLSERGYVQFLHLLRNMKPEKEFIEQFNNDIPDEKDRFLPNIK